MLRTGATDPLLTGASPRGYSGAMDVVALEFFFIGLLGLASLAIAFVAGTVLWNLFRGQR